MIDRFFSVAFDNFWERVRFLLTFFHNVLHLFLCAITFVLLFIYYIFYIQWWGKFNSYE